MLIADWTSEAKMKLIEIMCNLSAAVSAEESGTADATMTALVATANSAPTPTPKRVFTSTGLIRNAAKATNGATIIVVSSLMAASWLSRRRSMENVKRENSERAPVGSEMSP
jgi:hypothetical protein